CDRSSDRCETSTAARASTRFQYARWADEVSVTSSSCSPISEISWLRWEMATWPRSGSSLKLRSNGCETAACNCAVTDGLKFDSVKFAFVLSELQPNV